MRILPFKIPKHDNNALIYQVDKGASFYNQLHQHEEIQISLIVKGQGDLIVGDTINRFQENDVFILGSNVPHLFRGDTDTKQTFHMLTLFFTKEAFGKGFFNLPELEVLNKLIERTHYGLRIKSRKNEIQRYFFSLENASSLERLIAFFSILNEVDRSEQSLLSTFVHRKPYSEDEGTRMSNVMNYAISKFHTDIHLSEVAGLANMTPNAFCRYFKRRTNKSFFQFLLEIRIEHACRLLIDQVDKSVAEISEESGFKNTSNFNRKFKEYKKLTPTQFRRNKKK